MDAGKADFTPGPESIESLIAAGASADIKRILGLIPPHDKRQLKSAFDHIKAIPSDPNLKHLCREAIRRELLKIDATNLFSGDRVRQLGLPRSLVSYLLYDISLDKSGSG